MMELELMPFYSDLLEPKSYFKDAAVASHPDKAAKAAQYTSAEEMLESNFHHYLSRKQS